MGIKTKQMNSEATWIWGQQQKQLQQQYDDSKKRVVISAEFRQMTHVRSCSERVRAAYTQRNINESLKLPVGSIQSSLWHWKALFVYNELHFENDKVNKHSNSSVLSRKHAKKSVEICVQPTCQSLLLALLPPLRRLASFCMRPFVTRSLSCGE